MKEVDTLEPAAPIRLWPGAAPGSEDWTHAEVRAVEPITGIELIRGVVEPTITPVFPARGTGTGSAVVIAPGGAFTSLVWEYEGMAMARWLAERGMAAFVLKYRLAGVPEDPTEVIAQAGPMPDVSDLPAFVAWARRALGDAPDLATADGEQAVRTVRAHAASWGLDPDRVGILGFSAGATVATQSAATTDPSARPAFVADVYGAIFERDVPPAAPPYFGVVAADDRLCVDSVLQTAQAWLAAGSPVELHVYETGGHGFAFRPQGAPVDTWTDRLAAWLATRGFLEPDSAGV